MDSLIELKKTPLGLFLTMDVLAPSVYAQLGRVGLTVGKDIHVVSCNNELPYLNPLHPQPAEGRVKDGGKAQQYQGLRSVTSMADILARQFSVS